MKKFHLPGLIVFLLMLSGCTSTTKNDSKVNNQESFIFDWDAIGNQLVTQMNLEDGERVLLVASPGLFDPLVDVLAKKIRDAGGEYLGAVSVTDAQPVEWVTDFVTKIRPMEKDDLLSELSSVDLAVMLPGPVPSDKVYGAMQIVLNSEKTVPYIFIGQARTQ
ncbi:MAG: hypothetical protein HC811_04115 [Flammeovirgaceae bacterium]|nr:hypothetical protein [Flammeovirgaceae bacterium]